MGPQANAAGTAEIRYGKQPCEGMQKAEDRYHDEKYREVSHQTPLNTRII